MKKLFISCPMKNRTEENIKKSMEKMHKIAEVYFDQELEVIQTYIEDNPPENSNRGIWYLGKSIELLSQADFFIGINYTELFKGCNAERSIASDYGIKNVCIDCFELMPDTADIERDFFNSMQKCNVYPVNC